MRAHKRPHRRHHKRSGQVRIMGSSIRPKRTPNQAASMYWLESTTGLGPQDGSDIPSLAQSWRAVPWLRRST